MITLNLPLVSLLYGITIGLIVLVISSMPQKNPLSPNEEEWLFDNFFDKFYTACFGDRDPIALSKSFGLEYDKYMIDCNIIGKSPNWKAEAMMRVFGIFNFVFGTVLSFVFYSPIPIILGIILFFMLSSYPPRSAHSAAERKKIQLLSEMPRFVDLLSSALEINLPVETAIIQTANSVPCVLSDELKATFAETKIGAKNWQQALESIAQKYEIDQLSDFVLNIITAFNKGVSITEAVNREGYTIRQNTLLAAKERTAKMTSGILIPLLLFKLMPLIVLLLIPIMIESMSFYGS